MEIYRIGSKVLVGDKLTGNIMGFTLTRQHSQYLIGYWVSDKEYKEMWFDESLVTPIDCRDVKTIGFKQ